MKKIKKKINFITIEGCEGVGKSTVIKHLDEKLRYEGKTTVLTREPGGCEGAEVLRSMIMNNDYTTEQEAMLFAAARELHNHYTIKPAIAADKMIICDRYTLSSYVYQTRDGMKLDDLIQINSSFTKPDITFVLDMDVHKAMERIKTHRTDEVNKFDEMDMSIHERNREMFKSLANHKQITEQIIIINADQPPQKIVRDMMEYLR